MMNHSNKMKILSSLYSKFLSDIDNLENARKVNKLCDIFTNRWLGIKTKMHSEYIQRLDGTTLRICIIEAKNKTDNKNKTGLLWLHGGGYSIGLPEQDFIYGDMFVEDDTAIMIMPDYKKTTEAPYPSALEDAYLTLVWMMVNAERLNINPDQIFIGGESAGGGLCAALSLFARDEGEINIAFQMPLYPMLDDRPTKTNQNNQSPVWNSRLNEAAWHFYTRDLTEVDKYCAPSRETNYANLPPTYTFVGSEEPFLEETKEYINNLYKAGIPVMFKEYEGCHHAFDLLAYHTKIAKHARKMTLKAFKYAQENFFKRQDGLPPDKEIIKDIEDSNELQFNQELKDLDNLLDEIDINIFEEK